MNMKWYERLWRSIQRFSIPNLMIFITSGMLFVYFMDGFGFIKPSLSAWMMFDRSAILSGQVWRILTFVFIPSNTSLFMFLIGLYFWVFIGRSLEDSWGSASFTRYYLLGVLGTVLGGFLTGSATNNYLNMSLFLAFAALYPDLELRLFFFLPIKAKYLGYADGVLYIFSLIQLIIAGDIPRIVSLLMSLLNFFLFFGPTLFRMLGHKLKYRDLRKQFRENSDMW